MEGTNGEYELVIIRPDHFLIDNTAVLIKHPVTQDLRCFYASENKDGHLREGSPTGPHLPPLRSRGRIDRAIPLNPILVNYAAILRLKRLIRQDPFWADRLDQSIITILRNAVKLYEAVIWTHDGSRDTQLWVKDSSTRPPSVQNLWGWPYYERVLPERGPPTALDRAFALLEEGSLPPCLLNRTTF